MKRRDFFKALGAGAASAAVLTSPIARAKSSATVATNTLAGTPLDGIAMADLVRAKKTSPTELIQEAIYKIKQTNDQVNAVVATCFDDALKRAETININSAFAGVPFLVKDCVDVRGVESTNGSILNKGRKPEATSWFVRASENAGLINIGMSNIPEMMSLGCTQNPLYGATRNPWDLTKSVHSSTGGGAAAVAAGYVPLVHSTDGGGSSRMPASACGIFGFKPSRDQLITGLSNGNTNEDFTHQSFMSRSVRDTALAVSLTENHTKDGFDTPFSRTATGFVTQPLRRKLRIAVTLEDLFGAKPDIETRKAFYSTVKLLGELGHEVIEVKHPVTNNDDFLWNYMGVFGNKMAAFADMFDGMGKPLESMPEKVSENVTYLAREMQSRVRKHPNLYPDAVAQCHQFAIQHNNTFFADVDVWLTPVCSIIAPDLAYFDQKTHSGKTIWERSEKLMSYTPVENVAGNPGMSVPLYWTPSGIPVGSHFSAARGNDRLLLELAYQLEEAKPWAHKKAPIYV
ncbi:amidase [Enterovibrio nigricans]|uniref:Amidase n=1 Tax=Enterovibrio nigricans DSM 22720 TaxID=1121868 RepID=A0A1T4VD48_9GAMM|nr:amidase family protein [Enterovibrio nigricans]SKA62788.1 amidase [Enterovibrio nigricans DSM 22720]